MSSDNDDRINVRPKSMLNSPEETVYILRKEFIPKKLIVRKLNWLYLTGAYMLIM